jgi:Rps23 Pro-64 3,4-dihydroxylase Tpa1-like proline 4-hydroxylase
MGQSGPDMTLLHGAKHLGHLPPVVRIENFLGETITSQLLEYAIAHKQGFEPSDLRRKGERFVDPSIRISKKFLELGNFKDLIQAAVENVLGSVLQQLGIGDLGSHSYEFELVWHSDGAFFKRHIDTIAYGDRPSSRRILTMVYYFHRRPKAFTGGQLRLYPLDAKLDAKHHRDVEPDSDSAVFFPSWFPHEVLPVHCDHKIFADGRFAINCWVHKALTGSVTGGVHPTNG